MISSKRSLRNMALVLLLAEAVAFLVLYIPNYAVENDSIVVTYIVQFFNRFMSFLLPLLAATYLFSTASRSIKGNVICALKLSLTTLVYYLPYNYLVYLAQGNDSVESLLISLGVSSLNVLAFAIGVLLMHAVMLYSTAKVGEKIYIEKLPPAYRDRTPKEMKKQARADVLDNLTLHLNEGVVFDLTSPTVFGIFAAAFLQFVIYLFAELVEIVIFLYEYAGDYRDSEIFYIVFVLIFIFVELFASHAICYLARNLIRKKNVATEENINESNDD